VSDTEPTTTSTASVPISGFGEMVQIDGSAIDKLAQLGADAAGVTIAEISVKVPFDGLPTVFPIAIKHGDQPSLLSVKALAEEWRDRPDTRAGTAKMLTLESFIELVVRHRSDETVTFANTDWTKPSLTAVIDYHPRPEGTREVAANGRHRVHYAFPLSEEWKAWIKGDGVPMEQVDFAAMIEDRMAELSNPTDATKIWMERDFQTTMATPAQLITLSRGLQVNVEAKVKDFKTLQSGAGQVVFEESHSGADGQPLTVPGLFVLYIAPFFMSDKIEIPVRLRYRVRGGKIIWFYQIYRPDAAITEAVRDAIHAVRQETGLPVYEGAPEMNDSGRPVGSGGGC
jgi:hypothetical protein